MATGSTRYRPDWSSGGIIAPSVGDVLLDYADRMAKQQNAGLDRAMREQQVAEEQRRWDIANARAQGKEDRELAEKNATQEAMKAVMDPKAYQEQKMAGEQAGIEASLRNLNPQERAVAEQQLKENYDKNLSREQWFTGAVGNANADQAKVLTTQKAVYDIAANTPGTPEYRARVDAEFENNRRLVEMQANAEKDLAGYKAAIMGKSSGGLSSIDAKKFQKLEDKREEAAILGIEVSPEDSTIGLEYKIQNYKTNADKATKIKDELALAEAKAVKERGNLLGFDTKRGITGYDEYVANVNPDVGKGDFFGRSNDRLLNKMLTDQQTVMGLQKRGVGAKELTELIEKRTASGAKRGDDFEDVLEAISKQYRNDGETFDTSYSPLYIYD